MIFLSIHYANAGASEYFQNKLFFWRPQFQDFEKLKERGPDSKFLQKPTLPLCYYVNENCIINPLTTDEISKLLKKNFIENFIFLQIYGEYSAAKLHQFLIVSNIWKEFSFFALGD